MPEPMTGGCQCGAVRYEITAEPLSFICCHCTECQQQAASAFGLSLYVPTEGFRIVQGETHVWQRPTDSGKRLACHFCPTCGTRVFHRSSTNGGITSVKAGSLDDAAGLRPVANLWTRSAQPWVSFPDGMLTYEKDFDEFDALVVRWREVRAEAGD